MIPFFCEVLYRSTMFTGIITDIATLASAERQAGGMRCVIHTAYPADSLALGCSIACNGVCLTVVEKGRDAGQNWFAVEISQETLDCTTLDAWQEGMKINLERALKAGDELGGHVVSGHVDAIGEIVEIAPLSGHHRVSVVCPAALLPFIAVKGSITVDGVSLTVNQVEGNRFSVNIIPHTLEQTVFKYYKPGDKVNLEIDMLARYTARLLGFVNIF